MSIDPRKINLSERDLEDYLFENPSLVEMPYSFTPVMEWIGRQLHVPSGIIDLLGVTKNNCLVVVELKNAPFTTGHITQVCRYSRDIECVAEMAGLIFTKPVKLLIGTYEPSTELIVEAESVEVSFSTIDIKYEISIGGHWIVSDEYKEKRNKRLVELSETEQFIRLSTLSQAQFAADLSDKEEIEDNG